MKIIKRLFYGFLVLTFCLTVGAFVYIHVFACDVLQERLSQRLEQPVVISRVTYHFPYGIKIEDFQIADVVSIERVYIQFNLASLWDDTIKFRQFDIINPVLTFQDQSLASWNKSSVAAASIEENGDEQMSEDNRSKTGRLYDIGRVNIINGRLDIAQSHGQPPLRVELNNVRGHFNSVAVPWRARKMPFHFEATAGMNILRSELTQRPAIGKGWLDPRRQRLEGELFLQDPNGADQMSMKLTIGENKLAVDGNLHTEVSPQAEAQNQGRVWDRMARPVVKQLTKGQGVRFHTQFSVRDELDKFRLDTMVIEFKGVAMQPEPVEKKVLPAE